MSDAMKIALIGGIVGLISTFLPILLNRAENTVLKQNKKMCWIVQKNKLNF